MTARARRAWVEDVHDLAANMSHVRVNEGSRRGSMHLGAATWDCVWARHDG